MTIDIGYDATIVAVVDSLSLKQELYSTETADDLWVYPDHSNYSSLQPSF